MYNKNKCRKINDKKVLHKVGKQWKVVSVALLLALAGGAIVTSHVNASQMQTNQSSTDTNVAKNVQDQANTLHSHLLTAAQPQPNSAKATSAGAIKSQQSSSSANRPHMVLGETQQISDQMTSANSMTTQLSNSISTAYTSASNQLAGFSSNKALNDDYNNMTNASHEFNNDNHSWNNFYDDNQWHYSKAYDALSPKVPKSREQAMIDRVMARRNQQTLANINSQIPRYSDSVKADANTFHIAENQFNNDIPRMVAERTWGTTNVIFYATGDSSNPDITAHISGNPYQGDLIGVPSDFPQYVNNQRESNGQSDIPASQMKNSDYKTPLSWNLNVDIDNYDQDFSDFYNNAKINHLVNWNNIKHIVFDSNIKLPKYDGGMFADLPNLQSITFSNPDYHFINSDSNVMSDMFRNDFKLSDASALKGLKLAPDLYGMFENDKSLNSRQPHDFNQVLGSFDYTNVKNAGYFLHNLSGMSDLTVDWSKVKGGFHPEKLADTFANMSNLKTINLKGLDTSHCTDFASLFVRDNKLQNIDVSGFDTSHAGTMEYMFASDYALSDIKGLSHFDTRNVGYMNSMFRDDYALKDLDLSSFDTTGLRNSASDNQIEMEDMFHSDANLQNLSLGTHTYLFNNDKLPNPWMTQSDDKHTNRSDVDYNPYSLDNNPAYNTAQSNNASHKGSWTRDAEVVNYFEPSDNNKYLGHTKHFTGIQYWPDADWPIGASDFDISVNYPYRRQPQQLRTFSDNQTEPNLIADDLVNGTHHLYKYATGISDKNFESPNASDVVNYVDAQTGQFIPADNSKNSDSDAKYYGQHAFYNSSNLQTELSQQNGSDQKFTRLDSDSDFVNNFSNNISNLGSSVFPSRLSNLPTGYMIPESEESKLSSLVSKESNDSANDTAKNVKYTGYRFGNNSFNIPLEKESNITLNFITAGVNNKGRHQQLSSHVFNGYNTKKFDVDNYSNLVPKGYTAWLVNNRPVLDKTVLGKNVNQFTDKDQTIDVMVAPARPSALTPHNNQANPYEANITVNFIDAQNNKVLRKDIFKDKPEGTMFDASILPLPMGYVLKGKDFAHSVDKNIANFTTYDQTMNVYVKKNTATVAVQYIDVGDHNHVIKSIAPQTGIKGASDTNLTSLVLQENIPSNYNLAEPQNQLTQLTPKYDDSIIKVPVKRAQGTITVHYVDENGMPVASDESATKDLNTPFDYQTDFKNIYGYRFDRADSQNLGINKYIKGTQDVTLVYDFNNVQHPNHAKGDIDVFYYHNHQLVAYKDYGSYSAGTPFYIDKLHTTGYRIVSGSNVNHFNNGLQTIVVENQNGQTPASLPSDNAVVPRKITIDYINKATNGIIASKQYMAPFNSNFDISSIYNNMPQGYEYLSMRGAKSTFDDDTQPIKVYLIQPKAKVAQSKIQVDYIDRLTGKIISQDAPEQMPVSTSYDVFEHLNVPSGYVYGGIHNYTDRFTYDNQTVDVLVDKDSNKEVPLPKSANSQSSSASNKPSSASQKPSSKASSASSQAHSASSSASSAQSSSASQSAPSSKSSSSSAKPSSASVKPSSASSKTSSSSAKPASKSNSSAKPSSASSAPVKPKSSSASHQSSKASPSSSASARPSSASQAPQSKASSASSQSSQSSVKPSQSSSASSTSNGTDVVPIINSSSSRPSSSADTVPSSINQPQHVSSNAQHTAKTSNVQLRPKHAKSSQSKHSITGPKSNQPNQASKASSVNYNRANDKILNRRLQRNLARLERNTKLTQKKYHLAKLGVPNKSVHIRRVSKPEQGEELPQTNEARSSALILAIIGLSISLIASGLDGYLEHKHD